MFALSLLEMNMENPRKEIFNRIAEEWEENSVLNDRQRKTIEDVVTIAKINADDNILDAGSGTGIMIDFILKHLGENGKVTGIDVSDQMIRIAKQKYNDTRTKFIADDIYAHDFGEVRYDKVFAFSCFPHFHDKKEALEVFHRILSENGMLIVFHLESSEYMNTFHKTKVKNEILKNDYLPSGKEMRELIDRNKWKILTVEDRTNLYLVVIEKKP
jgi:ubiquinone/menaquinone biosynthesis C-methylase UbiE